MADEKKVEWTREQLAWAGAVLSTCTFYTRADTGTLMLAKNVTDRALLDMMVKVIGGNVSGPVERSLDSEDEVIVGTKARYRWSLGDQKVLVELLPQCWDWLSPTAQQRALPTMRHWFHLVSDSRSGG